jgi:hypothetical protein
MEELRTQWVYTALASSSHVGGNEDGTDSVASTEVGGMVNVPSSSQ